MSLKRTAPIGEKRGLIGVSTNRRAPRLGYSESVERFAAMTP